MREKIKLACTHCDGHGFYTTDKNKRSTTGKLELRKFCKICRAHHVHKETKLR